MALLLTCGLAAASPPQLRSSTPAAEAILDGRNLQFAVRFDAPVDHAAARLEITQDGKFVRALHPLLDSAPDVLFASGEALPPGRYVLHWYVGAPFGGEASDGEIPFSVKP
jgi:methionine-rich copper-binding protein CopC